MISSSAEVDESCLEVANSSNEDARLPSACLDATEAAWGSDGSMVVVMEPAEDRSDCDLIERSGA